MDLSSLKFRVSFDEAVCENMEKAIDVFKEMAFDERIDEEVRKEYIKDIFATLRIR